MAEAHDHLGTISSKKLDNTGITEDHLRAMSRPGTHRLVLMEVVTDEVANTQGGQKKVKLKAGIVELVPREQEDTVREFMRAIADTRGGDVAIPGTEGPSVDQAARGVAAAVDRDDDGKPTGKGIWDGDTDAPLTGTATTDQTASQPRVTSTGSVEVEVPKRSSGVGSPFTVVSDQDPNACPEPNCVLPQHDDGDHQAADG